MVTPAPPRISGPLPFVGCGLQFLRNPTQFLRDTRARHGDVFLLEAFGFKLFFVFSPAGLRSLYELPEHEASFTEATRTLIGLKLPPALLAGDMKMFHHLFGRDQMETYLGHINDAVHEALRQLGAAGELEVFAHMKALVHRVGFRCWAGKEAATPRYLPRLVRLFEQLDPEQAFVHPAQMFWTIVTRKAPEKRALRAVQAMLTEIWQDRERRGVREGDMLERLHELYAEQPVETRYANVAKDVMVLHLASQSNLYAALAWTFINLLQHPQHRSAVQDTGTTLAAQYGDDYLSEPRALAQMTFLEQCAQESIRLAQRSLTLRKVLQPCRVDDGAVTYTVSPGVYVATLLSVTNTALDVLQSFDPQHYERNRLSERIALPAKEMVSTFGHGRHSCPGERFAMSAIKIAVTQHLAQFDFTPQFTTVTTPPSQMGAVGRAAQACVVSYRRKPQGSE